MSEKVEQCGCVTDPYYKTIKPCETLKEHLSSALDKISNGNSVTLSFVGM